MKPDIKTQDFWEYLARIQDEVAKEVLEQATDDEYIICLRTYLDYMYVIRNMRIDRIRYFNSTENKYIKLTNEALAKRNVFIASNYIHISIG